MVKSQGKPVGRIVQNLSTDFILVYAFNRSRGSFAPPGWLTDLIQVVRSDVFWQCNFSDLFRFVSSLFEFTRFAGGVARARVFMRLLNFGEN